MQAVATRDQLRVRCTSTGGAGHIHALSAVAQALRDRGHDVRWAVAADGGEAVEAMGFDWTAAGLTTATRREAAGAAVLDAIMQMPMHQRRGPLFAAFFARAAARVTRQELAAIIDRVRPDVVLRETGELAAAPMAAARGIPLVTVAFSGVLPEASRDDVIEDLTPLWRSEASASRRGPTCTDSCTSTRSPPRSGSAPIPRSCGRSGPIEARRAPNRQAG